jgi:hypothetical protein
MRWPAALALALTLAGAAAGAAGTRAPQSIRGGVDLVSLTVTVTEGPRYVTDLDAPD